MKLRTAFGHFEILPKSCFLSVTLLLHFFGPLGKTLIDRSKKCGKRQARLTRLFVVKKCGIRRAQKPPV